MLALCNDICDYDEIYDLIELARYHIKTKTRLKKLKL
jgi:hypothetical protein